MPVAYAVWGQVAGQAHLDLVFWYWKLGLGLAIAYACVRATAAAVEHGRAWNLRTVKWLAILVVLGFGAGMVTYYVHLYYETPEEEEVIEEEEPAYTGSRERGFRPPFIPADRLLTPMAQKNDAAVRTAENCWYSLGRGGSVNVQPGEGAGHAHFTIAA